MKILITGANGFIGRYLCKSFERDGIVLRKAVRNSKNKRNTVNIGDITEQTSWQAALKNIDTVIHLASKAHVLSNSQADILDYEKINIGGATNLAMQCNLASVKHFIYISSIGVNGCNTSGKPFNESDRPSPCDAYAETKFKAEIEIRNVLNDNITLCIIRPPLVYGPGNPGNMKLLFNIAAKSIPLPLAGLKNKKSIIYVENLVSAVKLLCINRRNGLYLISDNESISTSELLINIRDLLNNKAPIFKLPMFLLKSLFFLLGKSTQFKKLNAELLVSNDKLKKDLNWQPPFTLSEGLRKTINSR